VYWFQMVVAPLNKWRHFTESRKTMISKKTKFIHRFFATLISFFVIFTFAMVWFTSYNDYSFNTHWREGALFSILLYSIIYISFARLYNGYKIGTYQIGEVMFSQVLAIGIANTILFVQCCLISNRYVDIVPGLFLTVFQITCILIWALVAKQYYIYFTSPSNTLVICNNEYEALNFKRKLEGKFGHMFELANIETDVSPIDVIKEKIDQSEAVMLYEIDNNLRTQLMEYIVSHKKILYITPSYSDVLIQGFEFRHFIDTPMMKYNYTSEKARSYGGKRAVDIFFSLLGLVIFSPFMLLTAIAIKLEDGGPLFFKQKRCTEGGKVFEIYKFRSMIIDAEKDGIAIPCTANDNRVTKVGRVIRKIRLDEVPQFINVLIGQMSIVGPRPERIEHVNEYVRECPEFTYRFRVKGGLTGYAQIYGKYNTSAQDKLRLDMIYIEKMSLFLDLKLIFLTLKTLFIPESTEGFSKKRSREITQMGRFSRKTKQPAGEVLLEESGFKKKVV